MQIRLNQVILRQGSQPQLVLDDKSHSRIDLVDGVIVAQCRVGANQPERIEIFNDWIKATAVREPRDDGREALDRAAAFASSAKGGPAAPVPGFVEDDDDDAPEHVPQEPEKVHPKPKK